MSRVFFSVDVETSGLTPWSGELLTVGVEAVDGKTLASLGEFYVRVAQQLGNHWYFPEDYPDGEDGDSWAWWIQQSAEVQAEAFKDSTLVRHVPWTAAQVLREFVNERAAGEDAVFVANPVAFDKMWIDQLFAGPGGNPFHYRSLCLRSMKFGLRPWSDWGSDRENHAPNIPHHALWDAKAQADDLRAMLAERDAPVES